MNRACVVEGFLSSDECAAIYDRVRAFDGWEVSRGHDFWNGRVCDVFKCLPFNVGRRIVGGIKGHILDRFGDLFPSGVYFDTCDLVKWPVGSSQPPHRDDVPEKHRLVGCVVYVNDDFIGGETFYPNLGFSVKPVAGSLALHLGDEEHLHGVTPVSAGERFTFSSFWGTDSGKAHLAHRLGLV